jgi:hypothetical protein
VNKFAHVPKPLGSWERIAAALLDTALTEDHQSLQAIEEARDDMLAFGSGVLLVTPAGLRRIAPWEVSYNRGARDGR